MKQEIEGNSNQQHSGYEHTEALLVSFDIRINWIFFLFIVSFYIVKIDNKNILDCSLHIKKKW